MLELQENPELSREELLTALSRLIGRTVRITRIVLEEKDYEPFGYSDEPAPEFCKLELKRDVCQFVEVKERLGERDSYYFSLLLKESRDWLQVSSSGASNLLFQVHVLSEDEDRWIAVHAPIWRHEEQSERMEETQGRIHLETAEAIQKFLQ